MTETNSEGDMGWLAGVLNVVLENTWKLGFLVAASCGFAYLAAQHGLPIPSSIKEWMPFGFIIGTACICLSVAVFCVETVGQLSFIYAVRFFEDRSESRKSGREALANLATLGPLENIALNQMLQEDRRFQIHYGSPAYRLVKKKIVVLCVDEPGMHALCILHPVVRSQRHKIKCELEGSLECLSADERSINPFIAQPLY